MQEVAKAEMKTRLYRSIRWGQSGVRLYDSLPFT